MSVINYSNFGTTIATNNLDAIRGEPGYGFAVDAFGNYDFQNNSVVNCDDIRLNSISLNDSVEIQFNNDISINDNNISDINKLYINNPTNNESQTKYVMWNSTNKEVEYRTNIPNPFNQSLNSSDTPTFVGLNSSSNINMQSNNITSANQIYTNSISDVTGSGGIIVSYSNIDLLNNNITSVGSLQFQTVPTLDNSETRLLCLNTGDNTVQHRLATTILNNPFDQSLNSTNDVEFNTIRTNSISGDTSGQALALAGDSSNAAFNANTTVTIRNTLILDNMTAPGASGVGNVYLYSTTGGNLCVKNNNGFEYIINDYFGKYLQSAQSTSLSTSTDTVNWITKVSIGSTAYGAGTYYVGYSCNVANSGGGGGTQTRILLDGSPLNTVTNAMPSRAFTSLYINQSPFYITNLTAANHTFDLQFICVTSGTAQIQDARIIVYRLS